MTIRWRSATVQRLGAAWPGSQELVATLTGGPEAGTEVKALAHPDLVGSPRPGDRVLLNTSALARGLGTGGYALVVALPDALPPIPPPAPGTW